MLNHNFKKFEYIQENSPDEYLAFFNGRKWGFIDSTGIIKIKPQYDEVCSFSHNLACVMKKGKWGFINKQNETVIPFMYDILKPVHRFKKFYDYKRSTFANYEGELCAPVAYKGGWGFINNKNQTVIPFRYEDVCTGLDVDSSKLFCVKANNKWGFIDNKRNTVIKFVFDNVIISAVNPRYYTVIQKVKYNCCMPYENFGLVDSIRGLIVPCKFRYEQTNKEVTNSNTLEKEN